MTGADLLLVAGEASGDLHGARLLSELKRLVPEVRVFGLGGGELRSAGLEPVSDESVAVVGLVEALKVLPRARRVFRRLLEEAKRRRPRAAVLIDSPDFNLRLAKKLKRLGVPVVYYVSPQVWAWRKRRVHTIAGVVARMLVLFPFEADFYRRYGVAVTHVGHPLVDEVPVLPHVWDSPGAGEGPFRLALLPGSRPSEVAALLPTLLETAAVLAERLPLEVRLIRAPTVSLELLAPALEGFPLPGEGSIEVVSAARHERLAECHAALCASGTATLETGLVGTPMVVVYRLSRWTFALARLLVRLPHISLVNLVLERGVVPEMLQDRAEPRALAAEVERLLQDRDAIETMRRGLAELRPRLGASGASRRAAEAVAEVLEGGGRA